ncbi:hypothetical protein GL295_09600 [Veillonella dispar]|nr:hypothetical protein [Veillonella dispar]
MGKAIRQSGSKTMRIVLAVLIALSGITGLLTTSRSAYAVEATLVDTGWSFDFYQYDSHTGSHWADSAFELNGKPAYCIDITQVASAGSSYSSSAMPANMALKIGLYEKYLNEAHVNWSSLKRAGYLQFMIWCEYNTSYVAANVTPDNDDFYGVYDAAKSYYKDNKNRYEATGTEWTSSNSQSMCVAPQLIEHGNIDLTKTSGKPDITAGNKCYSLAGAEYTVYSDSGLSKSVGKIVTDANGYGKLENLKAGTYYVKETLPSVGYMLDPNKYTVVVNPGKTTGVNGGKVAETPGTDPVGMLVGKVDATTSEHRPQSVADLSGAQFSVKYYDGYYNSAAEAAASGKPTRSWTFATDADGYAYFANEFKVAGDDLYYQTNGTTACMPLGTAIIEEVKAPVGYNLDDGVNPNNPPNKFCVQITSDGVIGESVYSWNSPEVPDTIKRGDYRLFKEVPTNNDDENQELTRIAIEGVQFQIINENENAVVSPDTGAEVAKGGVVCTLTTDENGFATTKTHVPVGWSAALAYGEYTVHEIIPDDVAEHVKAEHGIKLIGVDDWKIVIGEEGQYSPVQVVANHIPQTPLTIQKVDSTTGKSIPLACSFQIFDGNGKLVTYTDHMNETVIDTWTTIGKTGHVTLPMKLDEGTYTIHEVAAPDGYVLGDKDITFTVDEYRTWDDPITLTYADAPIRAEIQLLKTDGTTEVPVEDAEYCIKAEGDVVTGDGTVRFEDGQVVGYVTTDADGKASIEDLFLGNYVAYETKSPEGWALDTDEHHINIETQGQLVPVVVESLDAVDMPTTLQLLKVDSTDTSKALSGATFRIIQTAPAVTDEVDSGFNVNWECELTTGEDGTASLPYMPHGTFEIVEIKAPAGYFIPADAAPVSFRVDDQGFIGLDVEGTQFGDTLELTFENTPTILDITKSDATTGKELPGATLVLTDKDGNVIEEWVSTDTAHRIIGIEPGCYVLTETIAPEGYLVATSIEFTVEETGDVQKVEMKDKATPETPGTPNSDLPKTGDSFPWWAFAALAGAAACAGGAMYLARKSGTSVDEDKDTE